MLSVDGKREKSKQKRRRKKGKKKNGIAPFAEKFFLWGEKRKGEAEEILEKGEGGQGAIELKP